MDPAEGPWAALLPVVDALDALGVAWHVGGSVASSLHGVFRATNDVDLVAELDSIHAAPLASALGATHACDEAWIRDAIVRHSSFNAIHDASGFKIDVFVPVGAPFARSVMERRIRLVLPGTERAVFVASPEDIVLQKLRWFRDGGEVAQQQWRDVLGVIKLQGSLLDGAYLHAWGTSLAVADLLDRALAEGA